MTADMIHGFTIRIEWFALGAIWMLCAGTIVFSLTMAAGRSSRALESFGEADALPQNAAKNGGANNESREEIV